MLYLKKHFGMQFNEKQHFTQIWVWILLTGLLISSLFPLFRKPNPSIISILIYTSPMVVIMILFAVMYLQTSINSEGISIQFNPFHRKPKVFKWNEINSIELLKYSPLFEYGGWGIRGIGDDKAYNIKGNIGLKIRFKNGKKILIGTQKPEEINKLLNILKEQHAISFQNKLT